MNYRNRLTVTTLSFLFVLLLSSVTSASAATYYVSSAGSDSNNGTSTTTPWQSLSKVSSANLVAGDSVLFRRGDTFVGTLSVSHSGTSTNPITFGAYGTGNLPILSGGTTITTWTNLGGGIYEAPLATAPKVVVVGGQEYAPGRYPDTGWLTIDNTNGSNITSSGLSGQSGLAGAQAVIRTNRFIIEKTNITSQSGNTINVSGNAYSIESGYGFFITNKLSTLTTYGEWFYDTSAHKLKVYFGSAGPTTVVASTINRVLTMDTQTDVLFTNLDFKHASEFLAYLSDTQRVTFDAVNMSFSGVSGLFGYGNNRQLTFKNSSMSYIDSDGIKIYGNDDTGLLIQNNTFNNMGIFAGEGGVNEYRAISMEQAPINATIIGNYINNVGYAGISGAGPNTLIKNNVITNFCTMMDDGGGIYIQSSAGTGRRLTGNIISNGGIGAGAGTPYPSSNQAYGIYSDASNSYTEMDNNSITNVGQGGIYFDDSNHINIHDNTLYNNVKGISLEFLGYSNNAYPVNNIQVNNNIVVSNDTTSTLFATERPAGGIAISQWGTMDNNYYARPLNDTTTIRSEGTSYTLAQWQAATPYDHNSHKSPIALTNPSDIRYEYNDTNAPKTVSLGANYIDVKNVSYPGTVTLQPYTSVVLLRTSGTPAPDTTAPSVPTNLAGTAISQSQINLSWSPSTDNVGVTGYKIYRNGTQVGTSTTTSYANTGLTAGTSYSFAVSAYDAAGNNSAQSTTISITTQSAPDTTAPTISLTAPTAGATVAGIATISASASDNVGVTNVEFYRGTTLLGSDNSSPYSFSWNTATVANGSYALSAKAYDAAGNTGTSASITVTVNNASSAPDTTPPTVPTNLNGSATSQTQISLTWTASTDNIAVAGYRVFRNSTQIATTATNAYSDSGLTAGTTYSYTVSAFDAAGNVSAQSVAKSITTQSTPASTKFVIGDRVQVTTLALNVRATASINGTLLGNQTQGSLGTVIGGPVAQDGYNWWNINYDNAPDGWSVEDYLVRYTAPTGDTTPPVATITAPVAGATVSGTTTVGVYATDNVLVDHVDLYYDNTLIFSDHTAPPTFYMNWNTTSATNGTHTLTAKAYDSSGNIGTSAGVVVTVNNTTTPTNISPTANAGADQSITLPISSVTLAGSGTDPDGSIVSYAWTKVSGTGGTITTPTSAGTTVTGLTAGSYTFQLTVTDNQGATGVDSMTVTVAAAAPTGIFSIGDRVKVVGSNARVRATPSTSGTNLGTQPVGALGTVTGGPVSQGGYIWWNINFDTGPDGWVIQNRLALYVPPAPDTTAPTVSLTVPAVNATLSGTATLSATASDNVGVTRVEFYQGTILISSDTTSPYSASWNTTAVGNGSYTLSAKAYDAAGNVGTSATVAVTVNNVTTPTNHAPIANAGPDKTITLPTSSVTLIGSASDPDNDPMTYLWTKVSGGAATIATPTALTTNITGLVQGTYTFWLTATDSAGASNADAVTVIVNPAATGGDTIPPTVSISDPTAGEVISGATTFVTAESDNVGITHVDLYYGNTLIYADYSTPPDYIEWNTTTVPNGTYVVTAKAYDAAGNVGTASVSVVVNNAGGGGGGTGGDTTPPTVSISDPSNGDTISGATTFVTAESDNVGITHVDLYYGTTLIYSDYSTPPDYIEWNTTTVPNGTYTVTARAYDAANNTASASVVVTVHN